MLYLYILANLFNICSSKPCFPNCWKISSVVSFLKNMGESSEDQSYFGTCFLSAASRFNENMQIVDLLSAMRDLVSFLIPSMLSDHLV